jgi:hypothetical protein
MCPKIQFTHHLWPGPVPNKIMKTICHLRQHSPKSLFPTLESTVASLASYEVTSYGNQAETAPSRNVSQLCWGMYHGAALMNDGSVVAWGNNDWGQATVPAALQRAGPTDDAAAGVSDNNASVAAVQIACGRNHTIALLSNRSVIAW